MSPSTTRSAVTHLAVVIPARDEASTITQALASVGDARGRVDAGISVSCTVVADACRDDTVSVARRWTGAPDRTGVSWSVVTCRAQRVGAARRLGTAVAIASAVERGASIWSIWLAHTDADTRVDPDWLTMQLELADHGLDAVAGIVELDATVPSAVHDRFAEHYAVDVDGSHGHVHGANLGMRASAYLAAGGWADLPTGEDHDLWRRLKAGGGCMSSTAIRVRTSARTDGRAPNGFAADIRALMEPEVVA